jgi:hypothetical protein
MSDFSQSQNKIKYFFFSQILNPNGIEIFWLFTRFLYIFLLVCLFKFCEFTYIGVLKKADIHLSHTHIYSQILF